MHIGVFPWSNNHQNGFSGWWGKRYMCTSAYPSDQWAVLVLVLVLVNMWSNDTKWSWYLKSYLPINTGLISFHFGFWGRGWWAPVAYAAAGYGWWCRRTSKAAIPQRSFYHNKWSIGVLFIFEGFLGPTYLNPLWLGEVDPEHYREFRCAAIISRSHVSWRYAAEYIDPLEDKLISNAGLYGRQCLDA